MCYENELFLIYMNIFCDLDIKYPIRWDYVILSLIPINCGIVAEFVKVTYIFRFLERRKEK